MFDNVYKGKRVLVTGHTGFKGSWLAHWLLDLGAEVAGYSLYEPSEPSNFKILGLEKHIRHVTGDIRDLESLEKIFREFKPDIVFHLAAQAIVRKSYDDPKTTFDTNLGGTVNVLEAVRHTPSVTACVLITSDKCYENVEWEYGYRETDRLGGKDPYSASKACAEVAFASYVRSFFENGGPRLATTRAGNVIGGGDWAEDRIVPDCVRSWTRGKPVALRNPDATRPWQHVLEPLSGYLWLGSQLFQNREGLHGEAFNFGPAADVTQSVVDLIEEMKKVWKNGTWVRDPQGTGGKREASLLKLSCDKAIIQLGWKATMTYTETVRFTADWYWSFYNEKRDMAALSTEQIRTYESLAQERRLSWMK